MKKSSELEIRSKQDLIEQTIFTILSLPKTENNPEIKAPSLGTTVYNSLNTDGT
jgi:hypothetical protein